MAPPPLGRLIAACEVLDCLLTGTSPPLLLAGRARPAVCRAIDGKRGSQQGRTGFVCLNHQERVKGSIAWSDLVPAMLAVPLYGRVSRREPEPLATTSSYARSPMYRDQSALASPIWSIQTPFPGVSGVRGRVGVGVADGRIAPGMNGPGAAGRGRAAGGERPGGDASREGVAGGHPFSWGGPPPR